MSKDRRDAERAARRAKRLAERAAERARRKEAQAERAAERAERLAERVNRRPRRDKDLDQSIEDMVDEVTKKAEDWIDEQTRKLFDSDDSNERDVRRAEKQAQKAKDKAESARQRADRAEQVADDMSDLEASIDEEFDDHYDADADQYGLGDEYGMGDEYDDYELDGSSRRARRKAEKRARKRRRSGYDGFWMDFDWGYDDLMGSGGRSRKRRRRRRRSAHLYRDKQNKKLFGVCAGLADYFGRPAWEMRLYAVLGLVFVPSVVVPAYFVTYWLMDDKPYYRRVTDRFDADVSRQRRKRRDRIDEDVEDFDAAPAEASVKMKSKVRQMNNVEAMKTAKEKFANIEQRLRSMEGHVTSSRFELQRELKKISGDN